MAVLDKLKKRRCYSITVNDEQINVRSLSYGELARLDNVKTEVKPGFIVGCAVLEDDGSRAFSQAEGESDDDFATRVAAECPDVPSDTLRLLSDTIQKLNHSLPTQENLRKN